MILVVSAFEPELADLRERLAHRTDIAFSAVGIGVVQAALGMERALARLPEVREVLFVGTAGAYPGAPFSAQDLVIAKETFLAAPLGTELPGDVGGALQAGRIQVLESSVFVSISRVSVATTPGVTVADEPPFSVGAATVEHMELASIFSACAAHGVPAGALLALANRTGPHGRSEWLRNHRAASAHLAKVLTDAFAAL